VRELTVLGRPGCHLCEAAVEWLEPRCRAFGVRLRVADVDEDAALAGQYGLRIPVVLAGGTEVSGWPLDEGGIAAWLRQSP
jgi:glutaredoxin